MSLTLQILQPNEIDELIVYEEAKLKITQSDEMERNFIAWNARWRKESLEHYLPMGWSFLARRSGKLVGYFLAQPLLFFDGQTQSLWVEHIQFDDEEIRDSLIELAYRLSREKHLQKVYLSDNAQIKSGAALFKAEPWAPSMLQMRTTRT